MPYNHADNEISSYDASHNNSLNLFSYYALILFSFTGLSTLIGMTDVIDIQDYTACGGVPIYQDGMLSELVKSKVDCQVYARECVFQYVQRHMDLYNNKRDKSATLMLQRRFEYNFRLFGVLNVIMLHVSSSNSPQVLHLVEVYKVQNEILSRIASYVFHLLNMICVTSKAM